MLCSSQNSFWRNCAVWRTAAKPLLFASSPAREATRRATRRFSKLFQPTRERDNRPVYPDTHRVRSKPSRLAWLLPGAFESSTSTIIVRKSSCTGYNGTDVWCPCTRLRLVLNGYLDPALCHYIAHSLTSVRYKMSSSGPLWHTQSKKLLCGCIRGMRTCMSYLAQTMADACAYVTFFLFLTSGASNIRIRPCKQLFKTSPCWFVPKEDEAPCNRVVL